MRRTLLVVFAILLICWAASSSRPMPTPTPIPVVYLPSLTPLPLPATARSSATSTPLPTPRPTITLTSTPTHTPTAQVTVTRTAATQTVETTTVQTTTVETTTVQDTVLLHPDGGLYVGDQVSFEVVAPQQAQPRADQVRVDGPDGSHLGSAGFGVYGLGQRVEAMMVWAWDTRGLAAGDYPLTFTLQPGGQVWTETVTLIPQDDLPWPEPQAHWSNARSKCCTLYYITGTAAERDLPELIQEADDQASDAVQRMQIGFTAPITITLLSRVLGHGGFASQDIDVTYMDRNYAGDDFGLVLHHEMIHILDARLGGDFRPTMFVEGLAVYESGGHFKPEPLMPRAAALLPTKNGLGWYIPLAKLADNFYLSQHEIGYLEGAALIKYMVDTWGWEAFSSFYRDIHPAEDNRQASAIDAALQKHFRVTFSELEAKFKDALARTQVTSDQREDLRLTVEYFNTARRYQQSLDPSAFFQTAWLMDSGAMRARGIVADYVRHPRQADNLALETMLGGAFTELSDGQYDQVEQRLEAINAVLDAIQRGDAQPFEVNPLAADYYAIVQAVSQAGYEVQRIELGEGSAHVWATAGSAKLIEFVLERGKAGWKITLN